MAAIFASSSLQKVVSQRGASDMESIILAGGLGTRLRGVIGEQPKCMAPVNGKPFLHYLFTYLQQQHCNHVILSLGYKYEVVLQWLQTTNWSFSIDYVVEDELVGTGGGILLAMQKAIEDDVLVLNGDTMMQTDLNSLLHFHKKNKADTTLTLTDMQQFDRYGTVKMDEDNTITAFEEKSYQEKGTINTGIYAINKAAFLEKALPAKFSFEKEYLEKEIGNEKLKGYKTEGYFIDIGVPADYEKAQTDFANLF